MLTIILGTLFLFALLIGLGCLFWFYQEKRDLALKKRRDSITSTATSNHAPGQLARGGTRPEAIAVMPEI
jgi:hypothetical protein